METCRVMACAWLRPMMCSGDHAAVVLPSAGGWWMPGTGSARMCRGRWRRLMEHQRCASFGAICIYSHPDPLHH